MIIDRELPVRRTPPTALSLALALSLLVGCANRHPSAPVPSSLVGVLNEQTLTLPGGATLQRGIGIPDTLWLGGWGQDIAIRVTLEYRGVGTYPLGPEEVEVWLLVGGDVRSGGYRGRVAGSGELQVLRATGEGMPFRAVLRFEAEHTDGEQRLGTTVAFRDGVIDTRLRVSRP